MKERVIGRVVGDEEIRPPVEIVIGHSNAHAFADVVAHPPLFRHILKCAVALVQEKLVGLAFIKFRMQ